MGSMMIARGVPLAPPGVVVHVPRTSRERTVPPIAVVSPVLMVMRVHPNHPTVPITVIGEPGPHPETNAKGQPRIWVVVERPLHVNDLRIIPRNINDVRLRWDDSDVVLFHNDALLRRVNEHPIRPRHGSGALDSIHHGLRLQQVRLAQPLGPREIFVHPLHNVRIMR